MIDVEGLSFSYNGGQFHLKDVSFEIKKGEIVALIGPSGAGKTTLLRCLNGLYESTGQIRINGINVRQCPRIQRQIGMVFQNFNLLQRSTILQNVLWGRLGKKKWFQTFNKKDIEIAKDAINKVGLSRMENKRVDKLSGGQQQRVGIARALTQEPAILLADEPVSNLDIRTKRDILELLSTIREDTGLTILVSVHNLDILDNIINRVIAINSGGVVYDGNIKNLDDKKINEIFT
jgi:phosphonate transport system ATP-binding protein